VIPRKRWTPIFEDPDQRATLYLRLHGIFRYIREPQSRQGRVHALSQAVENKLSVDPHFQLSPGVWNCAGGSTAATNALEHEADIAKVQE